MGVDMRGRVLQIASLIIGLSLLANTPVFGKASVPEGCKIKATSLWQPMMSYQLEFITDNFIFTLAVGEADNSVEIEYSDIRMSMWTRNGFALDFSTRAIDDEAAPELYSGLRITAVNLQDNQENGKSGEAIYESLTCQVKDGNRICWSDDVVYPVRMETNAKCW
jgi:hypothetical protein